MGKNKELPYSKEAEMAVLGALFLNQQCLFKVQRYLKPDDFYFSDHRDLYIAYGLCMAENQSIDLVMIKKKLVQMGKSNELDIRAYIEHMTEVVDFVPSSDSERLAKYAWVVRDCATRRKMIDGYEKAKDGLYDMSRKVRQVSDYVLSEILADQTQINHVHSIAESGGAFLEELERRQRSGDKLPGISTGFDDLDLMTGGLEPGKLYVLGGRPSMGKTALGLNIASNIAISGKTVMLFSLEMRNYEIMKRIVSAKTRIKSQRLKTANVSDDEYIRIADEVGKFFPDSMYIDDSGFQTMQTIANICYGMNTKLADQRTHIGCVMIDHLHLLSPATATRERRLQIGEMTRAAKILADKINCPVVLLSQLSRAGNERKSNRPQLSDVRESGDIEQDADVVMLIHREEYYKPTEENHGKAELIIAKNRDGETGTLELGWDKSVTSFMSWEEFSAPQKGMPKLKKKDADNDGVRDDY